MRPILIHAGFHKTGTSTVQRYLAANRGVLKPYTALALKPKLADLVAAARGYSSWRDPFTLDKFAARARAFAEAHRGIRHRALILSAEELSGHMPGREGIADYSAAPVLMAELAAAFRAVHGAPDIRLVLGLRETESWLASAYWEHVKSSSLTEEFEAFAARLRPGADLAHWARAMGLAAQAPVTTVPLDEHAANPAAPLIALLDLPEETLQQLAPVPARNRRPDPAALHQMLRINREEPDRARRKALKQALLAKGLSSPSQQG